MNQVLIICPTCEVHCKFAPKKGVTIIQCSNCGDKYSVGG
jgi:Zn-finger nucleic acid-binding protein